MLEILSDVIFEAISGKYPDITKEYVSAEVVSTYDHISKNDSLDQLLLRCRKIAKVSDDINNQVIALIIIENFTNSEDLRVSPLFFLHKVLYAESFDVMRRSTSYVEDFNDDILAEVSQIEARFMELEGLIQVLANLPSVSKSTGSYLLAHVFSAVIRIHYFQDGNGRLARHTSQYLLKCWGLPFISLPKVRNDAIWKSALSKAIHGNINDLASIFRLHIDESIE